MIAGPETATALAAVATRLAGRYREQSKCLVDMAQAVSDGKWADALHATARWVQVETHAKRDAEIMDKLMGAMDGVTVRESLIRTGLSAEEAAVIAGLGGTDGWD